MKQVMGNCPLNTPYVLMSWNQIPLQKRTKYKKEFIIEIGKGKSS